MLKNIREDNNLTQKQLARNCATTQSTISKWELRKVTPTIAQMQKLADALEVDLQTIVACFVQDNKKTTKTKKE